MSKSQKTFEENANLALGYLLTAYRKFWKLSLVSLITRILSTATILIPPLFYKQIYDLLAQTGVAPSELATHAISILMILLWIQLVGWLTYRGHEFTAIQFGTKMQEWLNNTFLSAMQKQSFQFFSNNFTGSLISKVRKGVSAFERITDVLFWDVVPFFINVGLILIIVGLESWQLSLGLLVLVVLFAGAQYRLYVKIHPYQEKANALDNELGGLLSDIITNNFTVKFFATEKREEEAFADLNHQTAQARKTQYFKSMRIWGSAGLFSILLQFGIVYISLRMRGNGVISLGMIVLLQTYTMRIMDFLRGIGHTIRNVFRSMTEIAEIVEVVNQEPEILDVPNARNLQITSGKIRFLDLDFAYDEEKIFTGLNLDIKPGEHIALVGESGSGKSTITKLLFRFYEPQKGKILIDDQDISQVTQASLRSGISMIPQEPILFHRSIKENIAYGRPDATDEEIIAAAKMARCDRFIENFPEKYDTLVGERGVKLSGGERQRVAIARAILENTSILVMDEATSALDSESEHLIQEAMEEVMKHKTTIVIAHRLSTVMKMDKIIVMDKGKIVETGSHSELLTKEDGIYHKLWNIQSGGFFGMSNQQE